MPVELAEPDAEAETTVVVERAAVPELPAAAEVALPGAPAELVVFLNCEQKLRTAVKSLAMVEFLAAQHC